MVVRTALKHREVTLLPFRTVDVIVEMDFDKIKRRTSMLPNNHPDVAPVVYLDLL